MSNSITILLVHEQAEEVKQITLSLRAFYAGCRIEAVYSTEEAFEWASKQDWHVILLDEQISHRSVLEVLQEIRRRAPRSAIIVEGTRQDATVALQMIRSGADYYLFKHSPGFLTELPIVVKEVLEKRDLHTQLDRSRDRYLRLVETISDTVYELDADGRFVYVSPSIRWLLNYDPQELIGAHYSKVVQPEELMQPDRRFHERRTGARATREAQFRLIAKGEPPRFVETEVSATALYDQHQRFLGTIGVIRPLTKRQQEQSSLQRLTELMPLLTAIAASTRQLLQTLQDFKKEDNTTAAPSKELPPAPPREEGRSVDSITSSSQPERPEPQQEAPYTERRRFSRIEVQIDAWARLNGSRWEGISLNISRGGLFALFKGLVPAAEHQTVQLGLATEVGVLEVPGMIRRVRRSLDVQKKPEQVSLTGLGIQFSELEELESGILDSLLEALRARSVSLKLTILLLPGGSGDLHIESSSEFHGEPESRSLTSDQHDQQDRRPADRRLAARVHLDIPASIELTALPAFRQQECYVTNLSAGGACLRLQAPPIPVRGRALVRLTDPPFSAGDTTASFTGFRHPFIADVVWSLPDRAAQADSQQSSASNAIRMGIRFLGLNAEEERGIAQLITHCLKSADRLEAAQKHSRLSSDLLEHRNQRGRRIAIYHDYSRHLPSPGCPLVILAPGYGETKKDYVSLAYYLASNGFHVLRYDYTNHVGESEGGLISTTLTSMKEDLLAVLDYADHLWPASPVSVVASGLAGRVALKAFTDSRRVKLLVLLAPVVDLQQTLIAVHQEDLIGTHLQGIRRGVSNILGLNVDADRWLGDAIREGYADLQTTLKDATHIKTPVVLFSSDHDPWVQQKSLREVKTALREHALDWYLIPEASQGLLGSPARTREVIRQLVSCCQIWLYPLAAKPDIASPPEWEIERQSRLERERARVAHQTAKADNCQFWRDYLDQSHYIVNFSDYWHLLDHIYRLLGTLDQNERILDAGCGNGNFGMFLLINQSYRQQHVGRAARLHYVGLDFVPGGLKQARINLMKVAAELRGKFAMAGRPQSIMKASLMCADLDLALPFHDNQFDRVICNLVISYLRDPLFTLRELIRVLVPNGKLVLTNIKPRADLSQLYRNFVNTAKDREELEKAKQILNSSGKLTQREREGEFHLFEKQELAMLLISSGAVQPRIYSTFANQAYIAVAEKAYTK